jgi:hypothetical protein
MRHAGKLQPVIGLVGLMLMSAPVSAQEMSEKAVRTFMDYAWGLTPQQFTKPDGQVIQIDKSKRDEVMVPIEVAREVIKTGRLSAHAQICDLKEDQVNNYHSLMYREELKKKWTPQQMIYINQLHLTTVMLLTGKVKISTKGDDGKEVVIEENRAPAQTCTAEQKQKVKDLIVAYLKTGPEMKPSTAVVSPPGAAAAAAAAPPKK